MKKILLRRTMLATLLLIATLNAGAQNDDYFGYANHTLPFSQIEKEWEGQYVYTAGRDATPNIKAYFLGFAHAYPNELLQQMEATLLGLKTDEVISHFVCDTQNGYIRATLEASLTCSFQMCYWRSNNGDILIGVAVEGDEYDEDKDYMETESVNAMMFYKVVGDELIWTPCRQVDLLGRRYSLKDYDIRLPQHGKDIQLVHKQQPSKNVTLRWNGNRFNAK